MGLRTDATNIYVEDSSHGDAGGDGFYSPADLYAFAGMAEVQIFKRVLGGSTTYYSLLNVQWGDTGANYTGLPTNWKFGPRECMEFATGRGFKTRTTNQNLLNIYMGDKRAIGDGTMGALGKDSWAVLGSSSGAITANWFIYGGLWQGATTTNFFNAQDGVSEICGCEFDTTGAGSVTYNFQPSGTNKFKLFYENKIHGQSVSAGTVNSIPPAIALDRCTAIANSSLFGWRISTPDRHLIRPRTVGIPSNSDYGLASSSGGTVIVEPEFSGNATRYSTSDGSGPFITNPVFEGWRYKDRVFHPATGVSIPGISYEVTDARGVSQIDVDTDANGEPIFGSGQLANILLLARLYSPGFIGPAIVGSLAPFRIQVNHKHRDPSLPVLDYQWIPIGDATRDYNPYTRSTPLGHPPPLITVDAPFFREDEIDIMLKDFGQDVSCGGVTVLGFVDETSEDRLKGWTTHVSAKDVVATIRIGTLPAAAPEVPCSTGSVTYVIREVRQIDDGAITKLLLGLD